jgi:hypothetical protein
MVLASSFPWMTRLGLATMWPHTDQNDRQARSAAISWLTTWLNTGKADSPIGPTSVEPISWLEIHRQDTAWLVKERNQPQRMGRRERVVASPLETSLGAPDIGWVRQNAALIHLLRTGQWQPVPSSPPDRWVERLTREFSGVTPSAAHKILTTAIRAIPDPAKAILPELLSLEEREWIQRNCTMVHELSKGQIRGIPASPSRAWIAAFQSAVGGTRTEIAAMLAIIVNVTCDAGSIVIAGD